MIQSVKKALELVFRNQLTVQPGVELGFKITGIICSNKVGIELADVIIEIDNKPTK